MSKQQSGKQAETNDQKDGELDDMELEELYNWVDKIPLSKPKKNINRDFSDGTQIAEVVRHYIPHLVELHNYTPGNAIDLKKNNWSLLNRKVFKKLGFELSENVINDLVQGKPMTIEKVLLMLQTKLNTYQHEKERRESSKPEADQDYQVSPGRRSDTKGARSIIDGKQKSRTKQADINTHPLKEEKYLSPVPNKNSKNGLERQHAPIPKRKPTRSVMEPEAVPRVQLEEKEQELLARDELLEIMQAKIKRLEHLLHLKDLRIEELQNRVESFRPTGLKR